MIKKTVFSLAAALLLTVTAANAATLRMDGAHQINDISRSGVLTELNNSQNGPNVWMQSSAISSNQSNWATGILRRYGMSRANAERMAVRYARINARRSNLQFDDIAWGDKNTQGTDTRIDVAAVPLPAGALLLLSALGAAMVMRRQSALA